MRQSSIGEPGGFKNWTQASSATNFYPKDLRLLWYGERLACLCIIFFFGAGVALILGGIWLWPGTWTIAILAWVLALVSGVLGLALVVELGSGMKIRREDFKNGLLTAGLIDDPKTNSVLHIAVSSLSSRGGGYLYGILRIEHDAFPYAAVGKARRIACVSVFSAEVPHPTSWHTFVPTPVAFGTGTGGKSRAACSVWKPTRVAMGTTSRFWIDSWPNIPLRRISKICMCAMRMEICLRHG